MPPLPPPSGATPQSSPPIGPRPPAGVPPAGGAGGMTMPSMNKGLQSSALAMVSVAVRILEKALGMLGSTTDQGKELMKALTALGKMVPPGASSPGVEQTALHQLMMQQKQEQPEIARLRAMGGGGAAPGGGGSAPPPTPPQPSPMAA